MVHCSAPDSRYMLCQHHQTGIHGLKPKGKCFHQQGRKEVVDHMSTASPSCCEVADSQFSLSKCPLTIIDAGAPAPCYLLIVSGRLCVGAVYSHTQDSFIFFSQSGRTGGDDCELQFGRKKCKCAFNLLRPGWRQPILP